jgi:chaperonin GroEL
MIEKDIDFNEDARFKLLNGVNKLSNAVKQTLGAAGNTVILEDQLGRPHVTKDGVTVAKSINLSDPVEHLGATIVKQASIKTADEAGDGTTTSIVITQDLIEMAFKKIENENINVTKLRNSLEIVGEDVIKSITKRSKPVTEENLKDIATISANNDSELGEIIADAYLKVGVDGVVTIEESMTKKTYIDVVEGTRIKRGFESPYMITDKEKNQAVLENPLILISDKKIQTVEDIEPCLRVAMQSKRPIFIVAEMETAVINLLNVNKARGTINVNVVSPEGVGLNRFELLEDLAIMTGAIIVSDETGNDFSAVDENFLGEAKKCVSSDRETIISLKNSKKIADAIKERAEMVRNILKKKEDQANDWHYKDRLSRLSGGIAAIHVGALTEVEMKEKKDRVEDAIFATRAALEEGIVAGGGVALYNAAMELDSKYFKSNDKELKAACLILRYALSAPISQILENASMSFDSFVEKLDKVRRRNYGYDVKKKRFGNMFTMGIIDPLKVTKNAIQNAISVSITILTTNCVISNKRA